MRSKLLLTLTCALLLAGVSLAQEENKEKKVLKNADIVLMTQNHFDDETLLKLLEISDTDFDISGQALIDLKNQGVSSAVLRGMLQATQRKKHGSIPAAETKPADSGASAVSGAPGSDSSGAGSAAAATTTSSSTSTSSASAGSPPVAPAPTQPALTPTAPAQMPMTMTGGRGISAMPGGADMPNAQEMAALQSQLAMMGFGGMGGGMFGGGNFSMNSYTPEQMPHVFLMAADRTKQEVSASMAQMAQTKFNSGAPSPGGQALRSLATQGLSFAAMGAGPVGMMAMSAFSMASGFLPGMRAGAPSMTYVWGLPGRKSARQLNDSDPIFQLNYGDIPGVDPDAFEPAIVRLPQTPDNYRLVGATRTKMNMRNMMSGNGPENGKWISEDRWPSRVYKEERGFYVLRADKPLEPGEYAVVLRPVKGYKAKASGLGGHAQVFYSVWDFSVPGATPEETNGKKKKK